MEGCSENSHGWVSEPLMLSVTQKTQHLNLLLFPRKKRKVLTHEFMLGGSQFCVFAFSIHQQRRGFLNTMCYVGLHGLGITHTVFRSAGQTVTRTKSQSSLKHEIVLERQKQRQQRSEDSNLYGKQKIALWMPQQYFLAWKKNKKQKPISAPSDCHLAPQRNVLIHF